MTPGEALYRRYAYQHLDAYDDDGADWDENAGPGFTGDIIGILQDQVRDSGSQAQAARDMGIPRSTLRRWLKGGRPAKPARVLAGRMLAQRQTERRRVGDLLDSEPPGNIRMVGAINYGTSPEPERDVNLGAYLPWTFKDDVLKVIAAGGGPEELQKLLIESLTDDFYAQSIADGWWDIDEFYEQ